MHLERNEIRVFSQLVQSGSFTRAAEKLGISQSAVSQSIANLEHKLNAPLFSRGRNPEPTEAGLRFFSFAQRVINEEALVLRDIQQIKTGALSTLDMAMNSMVNRYYARDLLLRFCEFNPMTRLKLNVAPSREIVYGVDEDRWELGFGPFQSHMPGHFATRALLTEARTLVMHESHPRFAEIQHHPMQLLAEVPLITSFLDDVALRPGMERLRDMFASVWEVSHFDLRLDLVRSGKGVTYVSDRTLKDLPGFHPIEGLAFSSIERQVGIYYKKHRPLSEGARRFLVLVQQEFE